LTEKVKEILSKANQISIQVIMLEEIGKHPLTSRQLRELTESMGGDYDKLIQILRSNGLVNAKQDGHTLLYSLTPISKKEQPRVSQSSINFSISVGNPTKEPILWCRVKSPIFETVNSE
jgi:nucleoside-triphosphatase THEP1